MDTGNVWLLAGIALLSFVLSFVGSAVGLILGHMRLPLLIAYLGGSPAAVAGGATCNLLTSGVGALAGTVKHLRDGRVSWPTLALMGIPSAVGAVIGALVVLHVNRVWSYLVIGVMLVISGLLLTRPSPAGPPPDARPPRWRLGLEIIIGLGLGVLAAITGLMLGSLRLPMMLRLLKLDPRVAVGTNMAIGCLTAAVAVATSLSAGAADLPWAGMGTALAIIAPPTALGSYLGGWLTGYLRKETVRALAGWIIAVTGAQMLGQGVLAVWRQPEHAVPALMAELDEDSWEPGELDGDDD